MKEEDTLTVFYRIEDGFVIAICSGRQRLLFFSEEKRAGKDYIYVNQRNVDIEKVNDYIVIGGKLSKKFDL